MVEVPAGALPDVQEVQPSCPRRTRLSVRDFSVGKWFRTPHGYLAVRVRDLVGGTTFKVSTGETALRTAKEKLATMLNTRRTARTKRSTVLFSALFTEWLKTKTVGDKTREVYEANGNVYAEYFGAVRVSSVTHAKVLAFVKYLVDQGRKAETVKHHITLLRSFFEYARRNRIITENPVEGVRAPRGEQRHGRPLDVDQMARLVAACTDDYKANAKGKRQGNPAEVSWRQSYEVPAYLRLTVLIAFYTGLRRNNVIAPNGLRWGDVDLEHAKIVLGGGRLKNRQELELPIHPNLLAELRAEKRKQGDAATEDAFVVGSDAHDIRSAWESARDRAGLKTYLFKDLRSTFATFCDDAGASYPELQALMGHTATRSVTLRYARPSFDMLRRVVDRLPWLTKEPPKEEDRPDEPGPAASTSPVSTRDLVEKLEALVGLQDPTFQVRV